MQLLNSNIPRRAQTTRYSNKKAQDLLNIVLFMFCSFFVLLWWRPGKRAVASLPLVTSSPRTTACFPVFFNFVLFYDVLFYLFYLSLCGGVLLSLKNKNGDYAFRSRRFCGSPGKIRTCDTSVNSRVLLPLSY